ncbi:hypothetical protein F4692_002681 [Nocardioides cavernae]|uniref:Uncharacterized protein n=1 Tax=Nocardioides cavernae TaxID=1921566 RepID=A0A7Y9H4I0_9ACTN|nr:hypothetical protein [Nocardioides cavernae]NYE37548.1 hypothetical protein [Nocardioides cavernae]
MTTEPSYPPSTAPGHAVLPGAIWAFGASFVAEGVLHVLLRGVKDDPVSLAGSVVLSVLVVTWFAHGVVRARAVRFWIVVVLVGLGLVLGTVGLIAEPTPDGVVTTAFSAAQAVLLWRYAHSPWFAWQRSRPTGGPPLAGILALAALAGAMGGVTATPAATAELTVRVAPPPTAP